MTLHEPDEGASSGKDTVNSPSSERETAAKQGQQPAEDEVNVLPGTGGPDDGGDVEVDPADLNLSGASIPGHPKPPARH